MNENRFGKLLRQGIEDCGISQRQLAIHLRLSAAYVNDIINGHRGPLDHSRFKELHLILGLDEVKLANASAHDRANENELRLAAEVKRLTNENKLLLDVLNLEPIMKIDDCSECPFRAPDDWECAQANYRQIPDVGTVAKPFRPDWCPLPITIIPTEEP